MRYGLQLSNCTAEKFSELVEQGGIVPAAYMGRYGWVSLERLDALTWSEIKAELSPSQTNSRKKHGEANFYDFFMRQMIS
jgi:predicted DNA-binding protein (MmcQ/YjbR family)